MAKAINVKIATPKLIKALEASLAEKTKIYEADEKAQKAYNDELAIYNKELAETALKHIAKAQNVRVSERAWQGTINVDFDLPSNLIKLKQPKQPERTYWVHSYNEDKEQLQNAIRILKMTDEELVSTSTYNAVARFL